MGYEMTDDEIRETNELKEKTTKAFDDAMLEFAKATRDKVANPGEVCFADDIAREKALKAAIQYGMAHNLSYFEVLKPFFWSQFEHHRKDEEGRKR